MAEHNRQYACILIPTSVYLSASFREEAFFSLAESCGRFSPQIAIRAPEAIWIEIGRSRNLISPQKIVTQIPVLAQRLGIDQVHVGIGPTAALAFLQAQAQALRLPSLQHSPLHLLLPLLDLFGRMPDAERTQLEKDLVYALRELDLLGVKQLGTFLTLPKADLSLRFGAWIGRAIDLCQGTQDAAWVGFQREAPIVEQWDAADLEVVEGHGFSGAGAGGELEPLLFLLKPLLDRSFLRLFGRGLRISQAKLSLFCEHTTEPRVWSWEFAFAPGSSGAILPLLRERLQAELQKQPLLSPVRRMQWEILETTPGRSAQLDWQTRSEADQQEQLETLWNRLLQRLGKDSLFRWSPQATHLPEHQLVQSTELHPPTAEQELLQEQTLWIETAERVRPSRLFTQPIPLHPQPGAEHPSRWAGTRMESPQGATPAQRVSFPVASVQGPERIASEWWRGAKPRDYYRLATPSGKRFWVFKEPSGEVFLHGTFD